MLILTGATIHHPQRWPRRICWTTIIAIAPIATDVIMMITSTKRSMTTMPKSTTLIASTTIITNTTTTTIIMNMTTITIMITHTTMSKT